jgi:hypothetical protein
MHKEHNRHNETDRVGIYKSSIDLQAIRHNAR